MFKQCLTNTPSNSEARKESRGDVNKYFNPTVVTASYPAISLYINLKKNFMVQSIQSYFYKFCFFWAPKHDMLLRINFYLEFNLHVHREIKIIVREWRDISE